ncbi:conserved Plasmodium protein, unknown function [Plasmodium vinckei]|uniref:EamA domain-containing protein n=1 Tax=Plasmodium vinckei TaxID=5860 RepID=A0A6V7T1V2_PLAVN|nr:conserved Plasmodium protein, unknown function [Plasmodium vinckei]
MDIYRVIKKIYNSNISNSLISSICGTLASAFFKKASDISILKQNYHLINITWIIEFLLRLIYFFLFIIFNLLMIKYYVILMKHYSAFLATIFNFSFNFFLTAIFGVLFFHEQRNAYWILGGGFIIIGLILIMTDSMNKEKKNE